MGWKQISNYFISRTSNACQFRWRRLKSGKLKTYNSQKVIKLEPDYLKEVRNYKTGSTLLADLKIRREKASRRVSGRQKVHPIEMFSPTGERGIARRLSFGDNSSAVQRSPLSTSFSPRSSQTSLTSSSSLPSPLATSIPSSLPPPPVAPRWTKDEDRLISENIASRLTFDELCILLPSKTNYQIRSRILQIKKDRLSIGSLTIDDSASNASSSSLCSLPSLNATLPNPFSVPFNSSSAPQVSGFPGLLSRPPSFSLSQSLRRHSATTSPALYASSGNNGKPILPPNLSLESSANPRVPSSISSSKSISDSLSSAVSSVHLSKTLHFPPPVAPTNPNPTGANRAPTLSTLLCCGN